MKTVITYGTYDLLHYGHIRLLERAKALGDFLIVGITSDDFDRSRGKINVQQSLEERIAAVRETGIADKIIVEEYEGQKIDDINRYNVDIFTVGSDWKGKFDYLNDYCDVVYLDRTQGVSSSKIRSSKRNLTMGIVGDSASYLDKFQSEDIYVDGIEIIGICTNNIDNMSENIKKLSVITNDYSLLLGKVDSVYLYTDIDNHYENIKEALLRKKHVLCEAPIAPDAKKCKELFELAKKNNCLLVESIRTAYSVAYYRLLLLIKSGKIGDVLSIDVKCTSLKETPQMNSFLSWGPNALLPVLQILGTNYISKKFIVKYKDKAKKEDSFNRIEMIYKSAVACITVAKGAKSESDMIITGTKGYIYVPSPWWKTDYFEIRYENSLNNKRYFYQLDGEGIRNELVMFCRNVYEKKQPNNIKEDESIVICKLLEDFNNKKDVIELK